jgi:hypothetical protein
LNPSAPAAAACRTLAAEPPRARGVEPGDHPAGGTTNMKGILAWLIGIPIPIIIILYLMNVF